MITIKKLELIVPTPASPVGSLTFEMESHVLYQEGMMPVEENENAQVELSPETTALLQKVADEIVKDISKPK